MSRLTKITGASVHELPRPTEGAGAPSSLIISDASKVSSQGFLDVMTGRSDAVRAAERQQIIDRCIRAIRNGNTYGFGPALVAECKQIMAEEDHGWALAERSAWGMSK